MTWINVKEKMVKEVNQRKLIPSSLNELGCFQKLKGVKVEEEKRKTTMEKNKEDEIKNWKIRQGSWQL